MSKKIAIINNQGGRLRDLRALLPGYEIEVFGHDESGKLAERISEFGLLIISGGGRHQRVASSKSEIRAQAKLVEGNLSNIPIVGICLGAQVIARAIGARVIKLPRKREGIRFIRTVKSDSVFEDKRLISAYQSHKCGVTDLPNTYEILGVSDDGIEIFRDKHRNIYGFQCHPELHRKSTYASNVFANVVAEILSRHVN
jgi:GMP synthase-like glutamine amidotransferase